MALLYYYFTAIVRNSIQPAFAGLRAGRQMLARTKGDAGNAVPKKNDQENA